MKIIRDKFYKELSRCWLVDVKAKECYRWFAEYEFLEPMWDYIFSKEGTTSSINEARRCVEKMWSKDKDNKLRGKLGGLTKKIYHLELKVYDLQKQLREKNGKL